MFFEENKQQDGDWFPFQDSHFDTGTGKWVFDDPEPDAAEFRIRSMDPFVEEQVDARPVESKIVLNESTRQMQRLSWPKELTPEEKRKAKDDLYDYVITGIKNAFWGEDKPIQCTRENKLKLVKDPRFDRFLNRCLKAVDGILAEKKEEELKNV